MSRVLPWFACAAVFGLFGTPLAGQGSARAAKHPYAAEPLVMERFDTAYRFNADGTGSKVDTAVIRVQDEAALRALSVLSAPYAAGTQRVAFVAVRVRKPNGASVETPVNETGDQLAPMTQTTPMYSDTHLLLLPVRGLAVGDRLEYGIRTEFTAPAAKNEFWGAEGFGTGRVVLERSIELRVPGAMYIQVNCPKFPAVVAEEGKEQVYRWSGSQRHPTVRTGTAGHAAVVGADDESPEESALPITWTTFRSWAELGAWFRGLAGGSTVPAPAVKAKADQLVFGMTTPEARIGALFGFVSREVRSINVPLGQGSWQPHAAEEVLNNQFGDSKDKNVLLVAMLRAEHLPADLTPVAVRTGQGGSEPDAEMPSPLAFGQVLTLVSDAGHGEIWLDPMPEIAPPGVLDRSLRDELALVIPPTGEAVLRRTPEDLPYSAATRFEASGSLTGGGALQAQVDVQMRGDDEMSYRQTLRSFGGGQGDRIAQSFARAAGLPGEASNATSDAPEQTGGPLHLQFELHAPASRDWDNFRIVPLEPGLDLPYTSRRTSPDRELFLGGRRTELVVTRLTLPTGFSADLPAAVHLHTTFADLDKTYTLERSGSATILRTERSFAVKQAKLPAGSWDAYRRYLDEAARSEPAVQLTTADAAGNHHPPAPGEDLPAAADLVREAEGALTKGDSAGATQRLKEAEALNPRQPFLWSTYAAVERRAGKIEEAVGEERRELKLHPEEAAVSHRLAEDLTSRGRSTEAIEVLKAASSLNPNDERTTSMLGNLQATTAAPAAESTFRAGLRMAPESLRLKLALARVLLGEGKREEGGVLLAGVATESQNAAEVNDAAFLLGDAGLSLPMAEAASRRSLGMLNTGSVRGDDRGEVDLELRRSAALIACWDTYGWILLKEGLASEAETWLRAAWTDGRGAEPGRHFASLLEKQGKTAEAARILRLVGQSSPQGAELRVAVGRLAGGPTGTAVFLLESAVNVPTVARFIEGDEALAGMEGVVARGNVPTEIPAGTPGHLFRRGTLRCGTGAACTFAIEPSRAVE